MPLFVGFADEEGRKEEGLTSRGINTGLQPHRVNLVYQHLHSSWELLLVDLRSTVGLSSRCMPAVVDPERLTDAKEQRTVSDSLVELAFDSSLPPPSLPGLTTRGRIRDRRDQMRPEFGLQLR